MEILGYYFTKMAHGRYICSQNRMHITIEKVYTHWYQRWEGRLVNKARSLRQCALQALVVCRFHKGDHPDDLVDMYELFPKYRRDVVLEWIRGCLPG